jgi:hypothetical protein
MSVRQDPLSMLFPVPDRLRHATTRAVRSDQSTMALPGSHSGWVPAQVEQAD